MRGNLFLVCFSFLLYGAPVNVWAMEGSFNENMTLENKGVPPLQTPPNTPEPDSKEKEEKKALVKRNQPEKIPEEIKKDYLKVIHKKSSVKHQTYEKVDYLLKKAQNIKDYNEIFSTFYECAANNKISSRGFDYLVGGAYIIACQNSPNNLEIVQNFLYIMERLPSQHSQYAYYLSKSFANIKEANLLEFEYSSKILISLCDHIKSSEYIPSLFNNMMNGILKIYQKKCDFQKEYEEIQQIIKAHHSLCSHLNERATKIDELVSSVSEKLDITASERFLAIIEKIPNEHLKYADLLVKILEETQDTFEINNNQNISHTIDVNKQKCDSKNSMMDNRKKYAENLTDAEAEGYNRFLILRKLYEFRNRANIICDAYAQIIYDIGKAVEGVRDPKKRYAKVKHILGVYGSNKNSK